MILKSRKLFDVSVSETARIRAKDLFKDVYHGDIVLNNKKLKRLPDDLPNEITGHFACSLNNLTNLVGSPEVVGGDLYCDFNDLISLDGALKEVCGDFMCRSQSGDHKFTEEDVRAVCKVGGKIYV